MPDEGTDMRAGDASRRQVSSIVAVDAAANTTAPSYARALALVHDRGGVPLILLVLLALTASHKPLRIEHGAIALAFTALAWASPASRRFAWAALPFAVGGLAYENFALLAPLRGPIHVADLYRAELSLFAIDEQVPAHWWQHHTHPSLDFVSGAAYATYLPWTFAVAIVLHFRAPERLPELAWGFLVANLVGICIWLVLPAAPPWYVAEHGLAAPAIVHASPRAAGAARFDALLGTHYFANFYARSTNVFGAMPSLHVAYPMLAVFASWGLGPAYRWTTSVFVALVAFAAVYLGHHYVLDVLGGMAVAWLTHVIVVRARRRRFAAAGENAGAACQ